MSDELDRRRFLLAVATAASTCACAACPLAALARDAAPPPATSGPVDVGTLNDYPRDGVYDAHAKAHGFFVVRRKGALYALGSTCTHKKTLLKVKGNAIVCPKHGARFALDGKVTKAPARRDLPRLPISIDEAGKITVDASPAVEKARARNSSRSVPIP